MHDSAIVRLVLQFRVMTPVHPARFGRKPCLEQILLYLGGDIAHDKSHIWTANIGKKKFHVP
jgi:hypothetical protein